MFRLLFRLPYPLSDIAWYVKRFWGSAHPVAPTWSATFASLATRENSEKTMEEYIFFL